MSYLWNPPLWYLEYQVCHLLGFLCYLGLVLDVLPPHLDQFVPKSLFHVTSSPNQPWHFSPSSFPGIRSAEWGFGTGARQPGIYLGAMILSVLSCAQ